MLSEWGHVGFLLVLALIFPVGGIVTSWLMGLLRLRPDRPNPVKEDTYECGIPTEGTSQVQFKVSYYFFALLFVVFDVLAVFLFPWALSFSRLAVAGYVAVLPFTIAIFLGLLYAWRKRALEWV